MQNKFLIFFAAIIFIAGSILTARAQTSNQESTLTLTPGGLSALFSPENFSLDPIFVDPLSPTATPTFKTFAPSLTEETLTPEQQSGDTLPGQFVVEDAAGTTFEAQIHFSNLVDNDKVIPFTAFSIVTLANDPLGIDPFNNNTPPASTVGVTAPIACLGWNNDIQANCSTQFDANALTVDSDPNLNHLLDPVDPVLDTNETYINVNPAQPYSTNAIIEFSDGEKALILEKAPDNSWLRVKRGVLGTTATTHPAGSGIVCHGHSAVPVTIISGNANPDRIGSYTVGFGLRLMIEPYFEPGNYTGTITFDISSP